MKTWSGVVLALGGGLAVQGAQAGESEAGSAVYAGGCVNCHGRSGAGMASFPSLAGRDASYIVDRLETYRARERVGPNSALMYSWAGRLSDDDIANVAAFISSEFQ